MQLTNEQKRMLKYILIQLFGDDFRQINPTYRTLELTEKMMLEMHACNGRISRFFKSLNCANVTRGFLLRCLKAVHDIVRHEYTEFRGCPNVSLNTYRDPIFMSGI